MTTGNATVTFYAYLNNLGSIEQYCCGYEENGKTYSGHWPNRALFCSQCGKIWGMQMMHYHFPYLPIPQDRYVVKVEVCRDCGGAALFSPSAPINEWPDALLQWEFEGLLKEVL
tara:strand:+ start:3153 stop:3494 length:342 start_codon:yes stop_codon:yes gene_type:complete